MKEKKRNILIAKSFDFAIRVVKLFQYLTAEKKEYVLAKQLVKSDSAVGALMREAKNAEGKLDFIPKLGIAQKECDESMYWLELLHKTAYLIADEFNSITKDAIEILKIIRSSISTIKQKLNHS